MRFYPILVRTIVVLLAIAGGGASLDAQTTTAPSEPVSRPQPMLVTDIPEEALTDLPSSSDLYSLLETMPADVISSRMDTGGLGMAQPARIGAHGSTWTQTQFRIGDISVTDPSGSGTPLWSVLAITTPANASTEPTDKSIPPVMITKVMPTATIAMIVACSAIFRRFEMVRKWGVRAHSTRARPSSPDKVPSWRP